ncbi:hypothetical protein ACQ859_16765 [Roseateles chitinivorans]|uniref:hypothetical protein n=1 Tax=Roseateles chitinivorans TaxID=2917965 RepID=UPI003D666825
MTVKAVQFCEAAHTRPMNGVSLQSHREAPTAKAARHEAEAAALSATEKGDARERAGLVFPDVPMRNPNAPVDARAPCEAWQRRGDARSIHPPEPLPTAQLQALRRWLRGEIAMRPEEARERLARAIDARQLVDEPATHWRAVKAWIAGDDNWAQMGFGLVLD